MKLPTTEELFNYGSYLNGYRAACHSDAVFWRRVSDNTLDYMPIHEVTGVEGDTMLLSREFMRAAMWAAWHEDCVPEDNADLIAATNFVNAYAEWMLRSRKH